MKNVKNLSFTNIFIIMCIIVFVLDRYIIPEPTNIITNLYGQSLFNYIFGQSHGKLTLLLGLIGKNYAANGYSLYRYLTVSLLHANVLHIILNMVALYISGNFVEKKIGKLKTGALFLLIVFLVSLTANPFFALVNPSIDNEFFDNLIIVGASGGVFGMMGAMLGICTSNTDYFADSKKIEKIYLGIYGFLTTWVLSGVGATQTTIMHNFGFILGFILGIILIYIPNMHKNINDKKERNQNAIISFEIAISIIVLDTLLANVIQSNIIITITSLIIEICALVLSIILSNKAIQETITNNQKGKKLAKSAKILSIIYIIITIIGSIATIATNMSK